MASTTPEPVVRLVDVVADASARLTPSERRLADLLLSDPAAMAFGTVAEVAAAVDTSGPTVVRFAGKLGFDGYSSLQDVVRSQLRVELARPLDRLAALDGGGDTEAAIADGLSATLAGLDRDVLGDTAGRIVGARAVWLVSGESSGAAGHVLRAGLGMLRSRVALVGAGGTTITSMLVDAAPGDVAVVLDFPRHRRDVLLAAEALAAAGVHVLAVADGPLSPLVQAATAWVGVDVRAVGPFDSAVATVAVAELLLAEVADLVRATAPGRIERFETHWAALDLHVEG